MPVDVRVGTLLADKYRLEAVLGSGGMGFVYRAVNVQVGRAVAIKLLREELAEHDALVERFLREARTANLVRHPNVVDVMDVGKTEQGVPFLVQELLEGEDLARFAEARGGRLSLDEVEELVLPIVDALANAHARGVVHRDIKPENLFVARVDGRRVPKLLDFGISKVQTQNARATDAGVMMGTPAYMPPEQVRGARDADARSDIWAVGVLLFEALSGRLPFPGEAPALFLAIVSEDAPPLASIAPSVPATVSRIVGRCLRRKPEERYPTAAELARDLRHALDGADIEPTQRRSLPVPAPARMPAAVPDLVVPRAPRLPRAPAPPPQLPPAPPPAPASPAVTPATPLVLSTARNIGDAAKAAGVTPSPTPLDGMMLGVQRRVATTAKAGVRAVLARGESSQQRVVALAVVLATSLVGMGVLIAMFHRSEGWPIARFLVSASGTFNGTAQAVMALAAVLLGASRVRRATLQWEGEHAGGPLGAIVTAGVASAAFFSAFELLQAA